ncbi:protection of telomeres protein 1a isoform X1 [Elaeis guineensis]|uniref:Protection of telomeres protein 1a isoform X1 n=1 Tax=Elaeis guineensis var. tenera TaxID=51953 RepID=A0A6I9RMM9_ELAGV|nr:protection of telomeres protein 1a isoform X1 [Elaeis guineensis]
MESSRSPAKKARVLEGETRTSGTSTEYFYLPLTDALKMINAKVNLFASVSEIREPRRSRGTDYVLTLKIRDQSYSALGLSVNFFAENTTKLPHVRSTGDIIGLHHVVMKIHNGEFYCVYNKRFSSFALFEGKTAESFSAYQTSTGYKATDHDNEFLSQLRTWLLNYLHDAVLNEYSLELNRIKIGHCFDLICKVLHLCETSNSEWVLFVWDGTDTPPISFTMELDNEGKTPSPLHVEEFSLSREVLHAFPRVGTVLRVFANKYFKEVPQLQGGGHWVKLCNMVCELQSDMWKGVLQPSSKIHLLSDQDDTILHRLKMYNDRITSKPKCQPFMSFPQPSDITDTDFRHAAFATLMDSLTHPEVTHRCKCIVRVAAAYPWRGEDLRSPVDGHYRIRLTLEDPTTRIHAYVYREDGEYFFGGYPTNDELARKMNMLLGITDGAGQVRAARDPPWAWCCLKSYYLDKNNPWETRRYRIFATKLTG